MSANTPILEAYYIHVTLTGRKVYAKISVYSEISTKSGDFFIHDYLHATIGGHYFVERRCVDDFLYCSAGGTVELDPSKHPASRRKN